MHTSYCWLLRFKCQLNLRSVERLVVLDGIAIVMERRVVVARVQRPCERDTGERLSGGERLARPESFTALQRQGEDEGTGVLRRVLEVHGRRGLARRTGQLLIARYGDVLAAAGCGLREPLHFVPSRAAGGQQERKGKDEKGRKDIRFSVHRLTTFLCLDAKPTKIVRQSKAYLFNRVGRIRVNRISR